MDNEKIISLIEMFGFEAHHSGLALVFYFKNYKIHYDIFWNFMKTDGELYYSFYETLDNEDFYNYINVYFKHDIRKIKISRLL